MPLPSAADLLALAARVAGIRQRLRAVTRTAIARDQPLRLRSQYRTDDRLGSAAYQPGDSPRLLVLRDLLTRQQFTVRTYRALAEVNVTVLLESTGALLAHAQTGPFVVRLAFCLALAGLHARQPTTLTTLDPGAVPGRPVARLRQLGGLIQAAADLKPSPARSEAAPQLLERALGRPRANTNAFLVTHAGHPLPELEAMLRVLAKRVRRACVIPVVAWEELADEAGPVIDLETGRLIDLPPDHGTQLRKQLNAAMEGGRSLGIRVEPLVVADAEEDLASLLPLLAQLA
jgi:hypothetical protein